MKFFYGILFCCFLSVPQHAYAKISEYSSSAAITKSHTNQDTENDIYGQLDAFRNNPTLGNVDIFTAWLEKQKVTNNKERLALVIARCNLGYYEEHFGRLQNAITNYSQAWDMYQKHQLAGFDILESCLKPLGVLYTKTNALVEAQSILELYIIQVRKENNPTALAGGIANLSVVYHNQGKYKQAIYLLEEGLKAAPNNTDLLTNLATNYIGNLEFKKGIETVNKSLSLKPNQPNAHKILAQVYVSRALYDQALSHLQSSIDLLNKDPNVTSRAIAKIQLSIAEIMYKKAEISLSEEGLSKAQQLLFEVYQTLLPNIEKGRYPTQVDLLPENTLIDALDLQAAVKNAQGQPLEALVFYERAFSATELLSSAIVSQQSQIIIQSAAKRRGEKYLEIAYNLYQQTKDEHLIPRILATIERSKATVVSRAFTNKRLRQSSSALALTEKIRQSEKSLANLILVSQQSRNLKNRDPQGYGKLLDTISATRFHLHQLRNQFNGLHAPELVDLNRKLKDLPDIVKQRKETFVQYFLGSANSYQLVISEQGNTFKQLTSNPNSQLAFLSTIRSFTRYFESPTAINDAPGAFGEKAFDLYKLLQIPVSENLVILSDGILQYVPFDALLTGPFEGFNYQQMPFLFRTSVITYALSSTLYVQSSAQGRINKKDSVLGVFPVFENSSLELRHSLAESKAIQRSFSNHELLLRADATEAAAFAKAEKADILHFSTHASGGSFTQPASLQFIDELTAVQKLYGVQLHPKLIVLSACETGVGAIAYGEGAQSLARGFQYAGVQNILFSLWKVNDKSTAQLMDSYYTHLSQTHSRDLSMRLAKLDYLENPEISNVKKISILLGFFCVLWREGR